MNEELRKKIPKEMIIKGAKGKLFRAMTIYEPKPAGWITYLEYRFKTRDLNEKLLGLSECIICDKEIPHAKMKTHIVDNHSETHPEWVRKYLQREKNANTH